MVGTSDAYLDRYVETLPETFDPTRFDPDEWARLARVAGFEYVVFTTKHHNGFAMWDTETTEFNVMNTPYGEDVVQQIVDVFRDWGIPVGFYFSPDDFWLLRQQGTEITRNREKAQPSNNPELMKHNKAQLRELLTNYGPVDLLFLDGEPVGLRELTWELQPDIVVTRGAMETPEQELREDPLDEAWEACMTVGSQWSYKAGNEEYKSGTELIETLIETRAKGGNLLLNVGPRPDGTVPRTQEDRLRELGLWNFLNREAVVGTRPCPQIREGNVWLTRAADEAPTSVYATVTGMRWPMDDEPRTIALESIRATDDTEIGILSQSGQVFEYQPDVTPEASWTQGDNRLYMTVTHAHRIYNPDTYDDIPEDVKWPNPVVVEITDAEPAD